MKNSKIKYFFGMAMMSLFFIATMPNDATAQRRGNRQGQVRQSNVQKNNGLAAQRNNFSGRRNNYSSRRNNYSARRNNYSSRRNNFSSRRNNFNSRRNNFSSRRVYRGARIGSRVSRLHRNARFINYNSINYWYYNGSYYCRDRYGYVVTAPPVGIHIGF